MSAIETMIAFCGAFLISSGLMSINTAKENNVRKANIYNYVGLGILTIIPAFYFPLTTNVDIYRYFVHFYGDSQISWTELWNNSSSEFGFYGIAKISYYFGGRIWTVGLISCIIVLLYYLFIINGFENVSIFLATLTFCTGIYYSGCFNVIRQAVAVGVILFSIRYVFDHKLIKFIICVLIASLFHNTALISVLLYFFWDHKRDMSISNKKRVLFLTIALFAIISYQSLITYVANNFSAFREYSYTSNLMESSNRDFFLDCFELAFFLIFKDKFIRANKRNEFMLNLLILSIMIGFTGFYNPYLKRIAYYFSVPAKTVLFGYLPCLSNKGDNKQSISFLTAIFIIFIWIFTTYIIKAPFIYNYDLTNKPY